MAIPFPEPWLDPTKSGSTTLAVWRDGRIVTEHGEATPARTWPAIRRAVIKRHLTLYADALDSEPFDEAPYDGATVNLREDGRWIGLSFRVGRRRYTIYDAQTAWNRPATPELLADIRAVYAAAGVRARPTTASGLGVWAMRRYWGGAERVGRPSFPLYRVLREELVGGRVDTLQPGRVFPTLYELDMHSAYAAAAAEHLPGGAAVWWPGTSAEPGPDKAVTGYYYCTWTVHHPLPLGPVVIRGRDGDPNVAPATPGRYSGWLWAEDIALLRQQYHGIERAVTVIPWRGWYWRRWARVRKSADASPLTGWAHTLDRLRRSPRLTKPQRAMAKGAIVAAIGRFGADIDAGRELRSVRAAPEDREVPHPRTGAPLYEHRSSRDSAVALVHWASFVQARVRRQLYEAALPYVRAGTLVASNYDALYVTERPHGRWNRKALGTWKLRRLTQAWVPAPRHLVSAQKVTLPGIPLAGREIPMPGGLTAGVLSA